MNLKHIPLVALFLVIVAVVAVLVFKPADFDFELNLKKYHTAKVDGKEFIFYGSFGKVGSVTVKQDGKKLAKLDIEADADIYGDDLSAVEVCDINADGKNDLLVAVAVDEDGDVHRSLFLAVNDTYSRIKDVDAVNFTSEEGKLVCEEQKFTYLAETVEEYTVSYEQSVIKTVYEFYDGTVIASSKTAVSYYSESDIYCVGLWTYDANAEELFPVSEDWLTPKEYSRAYSQLDEIFEAELP